MDTNEKVRENRLRRAAKRQGFRLEKFRARDPRHRAYNKWIIRELDAREVLPGYRWAVAYGLTLDQVEAYLFEGWRQSEAEKDALRHLPLLREDES